MKLPALALTLVAALPSIAVASPITYAYTATVGSSAVPGLAKNDVISGFFTYDSTGVDSQVSPTFGQYNNMPSAISGSKVGFSVASSGLGTLSLTDTSPSPGLDLFDLTISGGTSSLAGYTVVNTQVKLQQTVGAGPFSSDAIPLFVMTLPMFNNAPTLDDTVTFRFLNPTGGAVFATANITSLTPVVTPEPATLSLVGIGIAAGAWRRRRARRG